MTEEIRGKSVVIGRPSYEIYNAFSDMRNLTARLPEQYRDKVTAESDTITVTVQGFNLGVKVNDRVPFSRIDFAQYGNAPFPFLFSMFMEPKDDTTTFFHIELRCELNMMMKMMLGKKLQEMVDKITDGVAQAASGKMPEGYEQFMADVTG